mmetsp:Transcript_1363/g.4707  ORF Transcript_1363/g.4707 Transcript_1363/m.4707 type:complete len:95 (+) Transcript_1363:75-359(+)
MERGNKGKNEEYWLETVRLGRMMTHYQKASHVKDSTTQKPQSGFPDAKFMNLSRKSHKRGALQTNTRRCPDFWLHPEDESSHYLRNTLTAIIRT